MFKIVLASGLCAVAAFAQTPVPVPAKDFFFQKQTANIVDDNFLGPIVDDNFRGPIGITAALAGPAATIPGAPYSAQAVTQHVQTLNDGNRITQTTTNKVARDSKGRVYREESLPGLGNGNAEPPHLILIEDPVAGQHITLDSNSKTAIKMSNSQTKKADEAAAREGVPPLTPGVRVMFNSTGSGQTQQTITAMKIKADDERAATTDLGTQTIEGVAAQGSRITRTIPAGEMGNDLPIVITTETWFSPELKVLIMSKSSDPRMGETTYKLTNLSRAEPDPALFQIPADYTVKDQPSGTIFFKTNP
jgi:hypothetical protein